MTHVIMSGANAKFFPLLRDLVLSLRSAAQRDDIRICLFDFGLDAAQKAELAPLIDKIAEPGWDIDFGFDQPIPDYKKYVTCGPYAPQHFPGHETYVWIDADAWVQTGEAVDLLIAGAQKGRLAICQWNDRAYPSPLSGGRVKLWTGAPFLSDRRRAVRTWLSGKLTQYYSRRLGNETFFTPSLNAGVWALPAECPHWDAWRESLKAARFRRPRDLSDQIALNHAVLTQDLPVELLPAWCNWLCSARAPHFDEARSLFVEPYLPHHPIGILHLVDRAKDQVYDVQTLSGGAIRRGLRRSDKAAP
ncbi:MAG: hypothetical protein AAGM38_01825 [Pseudomonadota bacterium]